MLLLLLFLSLLACPDTPREEYSIVNAMLPSRYYPELKNNIYERVAASIAAQLYPDVEMV